MFFVLVHQSFNSAEEVVALTFISKLQVTQPLYKHLLKHNVAKMSEVLNRAQPYIQLEDAKKASSSHSANRAMVEGSQCLPLTKIPTTLKTEIGGNLIIRSL